VNGKAMPRGPAGRGRGSTRLWMECGGSPLMASAFHGRDATGLATVQRTREGQTESVAPPLMPKIPQGEAAALRGAGVRDKKRREARNLLLVTEAPQGRGVTEPVNPPPMVEMPQGFAMAQSERGGVSVALLCWQRCHRALRRPREK
jgi:hypothetical protein